MTLEHWFTLLQLPHFSLHSLPYDPLPPYETITDTTNARQKLGTGPYCVNSRIATQQHCLVCITILNIYIFRWTLFLFFIFNVICDRTISAKNYIFTIFFSYILTTYNGVVVQIIQTDKMRNEISYYKYPRLMHFSLLYNIQVDTLIYVLVMHDCFVSNSCISSFYTM